MKLVWLVIPLIMFSVIGIQESYSQNIRPDIDFMSIAKELAEQQEKQLRSDDSVIPESIKYKIYVSGRDSYPRHHSVVFLYDKMIDGKIQHRQLNFSVAFVLSETPVTGYPHNLSDIEYVPALKKNTLYPELMCRQGFENVAKHTGIQVCVKSKSIGKLVDRGWVKINVWTVQKLKNQNYDSSYIPIKIDYNQLDTINGIIRFISVEIWNLKNVPSNYSVLILDPNGEKGEGCSNVFSASPQKPHSFNHWKLFLDSCKDVSVLGNYTVIVSSDLINETFVVNVAK